MIKLLIIRHGDCDDDFFSTEPIHVDHKMITPGSDNDFEEIEFTYNTPEVVSEERYQQLLMEHVNDQNKV